MSREPSYGEPGGPVGTGKPGLTTGAFVRSLAAAGGALAGGALAVPLAGALFVLLFQRVGVALVEGIVSESLTDVSGIAAIVAGAFLVIAGVIVAVAVVIALVAPVFVVLPISAIALALRVARAGQILPTAGLALATVFALSAAVLTVASAADLALNWTVWFPILAVGGFSSRLLVELWRPERAAVPDERLLRRRWKRVGFAWLAIVLAATVGAILEFLLSAQVSVSEPTG